jgi:hypothetical protein
VIHRLHRLTQIRKGGGQQSWEARKLKAQS